MKSSDKSLTKGVVGLQLLARAPSLTGVRTFGVFVFDALGLCHSSTGKIPCSLKFASVHREEATVSTLHACETILPRAQE